VDDCRLGTRLDLLQLDFRISGTRAPRWADFAPYVPKNRFHRSSVQVRAVAPVSIRPVHCGYFGAVNCRFLGLLELLLLLPVREPIGRNKVIADCAAFFDCLAKMGSVPFSPFFDQKWP
jgi:hypothetical protein